MAMRKLKDSAVLIFKYARSRKNENAGSGFRARELKFLLPHISKHFFRYLVLVFLLLLGSGLSLPSPAITGHIIDHVFVRKEVGNLNWLVALLLAILIFSELVQVAQEYSTLRMAQELIYSIKAHLIERILKYPLSFFKKHQTGYLVSRLDEVNLLGGFFSATLPAVIESSIRFAGALFLLTRYNLRLTIIAILVLPLFFEVARRSSHAIRATSLGTMEVGARVRSKINETLSGIEVVKTFAKEGHETETIKTGLRKALELEVIQNLFSSAAGRFLGVLAGIDLLVILWVAGKEIMAGRLTVGQYVAFVAYVGYLFGPIQIFAAGFLQFQKTYIACKRTSAFLNEIAEDEKPARTRDLTDLRGDVRFDNVSYHYEDGKYVLKDIDFFIRAGEKIALVGKNGAGKSTLVHLLLGLYEPCYGRIEIDGVDIRTLKLGSLRNRIGIVSQNIFLFDDSILNNIKYSCPNASADEIVAAAKASGCAELLSRLPRGQDANVGEMGNKLSGGEKQRLSLARCLLKKPDLVIFDEPTAQLDTIASKETTELVRELFKMKTCIIISHNFGSVYWADRIFVLANGHLAQEGTHADLASKEGEYRQLFEIN